MEALGEVQRGIFFLSQRCKRVNSYETTVNLNETTVGAERGEGIKRDDIFSYTFHKNTFSPNYSGGRAV